MAVCRPWPSAACPRATGRPAAQACKDRPRTPFGRQPPRRPQARWPSPSAKHRAIRDGRRGSQPPARPDSRRRWRARRPRRPAHCRGSRSPMLAGQQSLRCATRTLVPRLVKARAAARLTEPYPMIVINRPMTSSSCGPSSGHGRQDGERPNRRRSARWWSHRTKTYDRAGLEPLPHLPCRASRGIAIRRRAAARAGAAEAWNTFRPSSRTCAWFIPASPSDWSCRSGTRSSRRRGAWLTAVADCDRIGQRGPCADNGGGAYALTKTALAGMVRGLARDLGTAASPSTLCSLAPSTPTPIHRKARSRRSLTVSWPFIATSAPTKSRR